MTAVHPEFDPASARWFVPGMRVPGTRTLADMQRVLGPGTEIVGYYPAGYVAERPTNQPNTSISSLRSTMRTNYSGIKAGQGRAREAFLARRAELVKVPVPPKPLPAPPPTLGAPLQKNRGRRALAQGLPRKSDWDLILDAWLNGDEVCSIANRARCSVSNVYEVARVARERGDERAVMRKSFAWSPNKIVQLCAMVKEGHSGGAIAMAIGAPSRSAVIGKANRLGLSLA